MNKAYKLVECKLLSRCPKPWNKRLFGRVSAWSFVSKCCPLSVPVDLIRAPDTLKRPTSVHFVCGRVT
jgi:hypothetical protein